MSDVITTTPAATDAPAAAKPKKAKREAFTVEQIAIARLRKRGVSLDRKADEMKVVRGMLRRSFDDLAKAAPASYGPKGKVKTVANDRRPWGPIPAAVAKALVK